MTNTLILLRPGQSEWNEKNLFTGWVDVGLTDRDGNARFNPPTLRGVAQRDGFLHDGRARSLREVFTTHNHPGHGDPLSDAELADLLAFLNSL